MSRLLIVACLLCLAYIAPATSLSCVTGVECTHCNNTMKHSVCPLNQGQDTCMKLDLDNYVSKTCVPNVACTKRGLENYVASLSDTYLKNLLQKPEVMDQLSKNVNTAGRQVINCCKDKDYCNNGMLNKLSVVAIVGAMVASILY